MSTIITILGCLIMGSIAAGLGLISVMLAGELILEIISVNYEKLISSLKG